MIKEALQWLHEQSIKAGTPSEVVVSDNIKHVLGPDGKTTSVVRQEQHAYAVNSFESMARALNQYRLPESDSHPVIMVDYSSYEVVAIAQGEDTDGVNIQVFAHVQLPDTVAWLLRDVADGMSIEEFVDEIRWRVTSCESVIVSDQTLLALQAITIRESNEADYRDSSLGRSIENRALVGGDPFPRVIELELCGVPVHAAVRVDKKAKRIRFHYLPNLPDVQHDITSQFAQELEETLAKYRGLRPDNLPDEVKTAIDYEWPIIVGRGRHKTYWPGES